MKLKILGLLAAVLLAGPASALTVGDGHDWLGSIHFGIPSGDADRTSYVNHLIGMALNSSDSSPWTDFHSFRCQLRVAVPHCRTCFETPAAGTSVDLGTGGFTYLFAKYDGPNDGSEVWFVSGLSGIIYNPCKRRRRLWPLRVGLSSQAPAARPAPPAPPVPPARLGLRATCRNRRRRWSCSASACWVSATRVVASRLLDADPLNHLVLARTPPSSPCKNTSRVWV